MRLALFVATLALICPAPRLSAGKAAERAKALATLKKLARDVTVDENSPGKPVVAVNFADMPVKDEDLSVLRNFSEVREINFQLCRITDKGLAHLAGLTELQTLKLNSAFAITDEGLAQLKDLKKLRTLNLAHTKVTGTGLVHFKGLTELRSLNLGRTQVTDKALRHLEPLTNLETVELWSSQVSPAGVEKLRKALPKVRIVMN